MANPDISRDIVDPTRHYSRVHMQQGRVLADADFNDHVDITAEDHRLDRLDIIGPVGTSDGGFRIANPTVTGGRMTFEIGAGTYYVGGLRARLEAAQPYDAQTDWLDQPPPAAPDTDRIDLVYAEVWERDVGAVEDGELFEVALGGPDTSTRRRVMCHVKVAEGVGFPDCANAWTALRDRMWMNHFGVVHDTSELVVNAGLVVGFDGAGAPADLCSPPVTAGYLGAENTVYRVEVREPTPGFKTFTWGRDDAASLYRVDRVDATTFTMLTRPRDHAHWPLSGQIVEIIPWGAVLGNGEKLAAAQGELRRVDGSYDPDTGRFTIQAVPPLDPALGTNWQSRPDAATLGLPYLYLRVWDRESDHTSDPDIPITHGVAVALGHTGLNATIWSPDLNAGDYWRVAARPDTPDVVVPWAFKTGPRPRPHGIRRFLAPLAVVKWTVSGSSLTGEVVSDCRETFRPLTRLKGCCTYTVGDGQVSHGDFSSVQAAVDNLPPAGGQVCLLPGEFHGLVTVKGRQNVTITGCGRRSRLVALGGNFENAAIRIEDSTAITVRSLAIESMEATGIRAVRSQVLRFEGLHLLVRDHSAIYATEGVDIRVTDNVAEVETLAGPPRPGSDAGLWPAVYVGAENVLVKENTVRMRLQQTLARAALGGIQIGGGSSMVTICCNRIEGGLGNGITLGSVRFLTAAQWAGLPADYAATWAQAVVLAPGAGFGIDDQGCLTSPTGFTPTDKEGQPLIPVSEGDVVKVRIVDNDILAMGANGIGVVRFFGRDEPGFVTVDRLTIDDNRIHGCLRLSTPTLPPALLEVAGFGGIALADCIDLVVRDNLISGNGTSHVDPVCGLYGLRVTGAFITGNRILDNAPITSNEPPRPGKRAGIFLGTALAGTTSAVKSSIRRRTGKTSDLPGHPTVAVRPGPYAAWIHGNVVTQPMGRALDVRALGSVVVEDNLFATERASTAERGQAQPGGLTVFLHSATVWITNLGVSQEVFAPRSSMAGMTTTDFVAPGGGSTMNTSLMVGGDVIFNDNRVRLETLDRSAEVVSSILLVTRDDLSMQDNQSECSGQVSLIPSNTVAAGWSVRLAGNRFTEPVGSAPFSARTYGVMNTTTDNQSTHCLFIVGHPALTVDDRNVALAMLTSDGCAEALSLGRALSKQAFTPS